MQACRDWVLMIFRTQVTKKKQPVLPVFLDYFSVSYDWCNLSRACVVAFNHFFQKRFKPINQPYVARKCLPFSIFFANN